jgi:hypothetical protein
LRRLGAFCRLWARSPPAPVLLNLIARALGARAADPWRELEELAADPASGIAIAGRKPF